MALTKHDKTKILSLYGSGYSYDKIVDETGHSKTTIGGVIKDAKANVIHVKAEGLKEDQIAGQLEYPLDFVNKVVQQAGASPKAADKGVPAIQAPEETDVDLKEAFAEYRKEQELEECKAKLCRQVDTQLRDLATLDEQLEDEDLKDPTWTEQKQKSESQLLEFVLPEVDEANSQNALAALKNIFEQIAEKVQALCHEYRQKVIEAVELRRQQGKKNSRELLDEAVHTPVYPDYVKKRIKRMVHVNTPDEASLVAKALIEFSLRMYVFGDISPQQEEKVWDVFFANVGKQGLDYIHELGKRHVRWYGDSIYYISECPHCKGKLTREVILGRIGLRCLSCSVSHPISPEGINPARLRMIYDPSLSLPEEPEEEQQQ